MSDQPYNYQPQPKTLSAFPKVVKALLLANVVIFGLQQIPSLTLFLQNTFALQSLMNKLQAGNGMLIANLPSFHPWQLITYGFLHGGIAHLLFNMFALWMFGSVIEKVWGSKRFLFYYLVCVAGAALAQLLVMYIRTKMLMASPEEYTSIHEIIYQFRVINVPTVGASGGVFGLLLAFGMMFPRQPIYFAFIPAPIPAKWFVLGYGAIELFMGVTGTMAGVAHFAHLGGMLFGFVLIQYWLGKLPWKPPPGKLF